MIPGTTIQSPMAPSDLLRSSVYSTGEHRKLYELYSSYPHAAGVNVRPWITQTTAPPSSLTLTTIITAVCRVSHACEMPESAQRRHTVSWATTIP